LDTIVSNGMTGLVVFIPFLVASTILVGLGLFIIFLIKRLRLTAKISAANQAYTSLPPDPRRRLILKIYQQGTKLLPRQYLPRQPWEALTEYAQRVESLSALKWLTETAEIAAYRAEVPDAETVAEAEKALAALKNELSKG
jgi:hypothetical protein